MGTSSSQPIPNDDQGATVSTTTIAIAKERVPRHSPKMDDYAASQQLFDELEMRANHTPNRNTNVVARNKARPARRPRKIAGARKIKKGLTSTPAASQLAPPDDHSLLESQSTKQSPASPDLQTHTKGDAANNKASRTTPLSPSGPLLEGDSQAHCDVEVPDSQRATTEVNALMSPPMTSSLSVPVSVSKKQSSMRTKKSRARVEVDPVNTLSERKAPELDETSTFSARDLPQRQRKRSSYLMPPSTSETDWIHGTDDSNLTDAHLDSIVASEAAGMPDPSLRNARAEGITDSGNHSDDDDFVPGQSQISKRKKIQRVKKAKLGPSSRQNTQNDKVDEAHDADGEKAGFDHKAEPSTNVVVDAGTAKVTPRKARRRHAIRPKIRKSTGHQNNDVTAADRALATTRELHHPLDLRTEGDFTSDEDELIRRAIWDYKERQGLETSDIVDIIQWTFDDIDTVDNWHSAVEGRALSASDAEHMQESREFWDEILLTNLKRRPERIRRHIRSQYHTYKSGGWTKEEDEQLKDLYKLHPQKWKIISTIMSDRSMHDIQNRYRDYVQHGTKRNTSAWSKTEEDLLVRAVTTVVQRDEDYRAESGLPPRAEYANRDISWPQVAIEMGGIRSRLQSSVKWSRLQARDFPPQIVLEIKPRKAGGQGASKNRLLQTNGTEATTKTPKKRGRPQKGGSFAGDEEERVVRRRRPARDTETVDGSDPDAHLQQSPHQPNVDITDTGKMRIGDILDLAMAVSFRGDQREQDIDWRDIQAVMKATWSIRTLQAAFHELLEQHQEKGDDDESFIAAVDAIVDEIVEQHPGQLGEHYDPTYDIGSDANIAPANEEEEPAAANTKKKRKRGGSNSRSASTKAYKSQEFVAESDDAGSELAEGDDDL